MRRLIMTAALLALLLPLAAAADDERPVSEWDDATVLERLREVDPTLYQELMQFEDRGDFQFRKRMQKARGRLQLQLLHPEWAAADGLVAEVEAEIDAMVIAYRAAATDEAREAIHAELTELATRFHDLRLDSYRFRLALLTLRVEELEQTIHAREANREAFIRQWLEHRLEAR
jgi:hypothetical protein